MNKFPLRGLQLKSGLLMFFVSVLVALIGVMGVANIQRVYKASTIITDNEIPTQDVVQEILTSVLSASSNYDNAVTENKDVVDQEAQYRRSFEDSISRAHMFLQAISLGAQSAAFKEVENGELYNKWNKLPKNEALTFISPSSELTKLASDADLHLMGYEKIAGQSLDAYERSASLNAQGDHESADIAYSEGLELGGKAIMGYLDPLNNDLKSMHVSLNTQIQNEMLSLNVIFSRILISSIVISIATVIFILAIGSFFAHFLIIKPLRTLASAFEEIAQGDVHKRVTWNSKDEIGILSKSFNLMAEKLEEAHGTFEKKIEEKTSDLSKILLELGNKNKDLEHAQMATVNLLEDLEEEKEAVELKVIARTADIEKEKNKLLQVTSNMSGGGILLDADKHTIFTNDGAYELLDVDRSVRVEEMLNYFSAYFEESNIKEKLERCFEGTSFHVPEIDGRGRVYEIFFHHLRNEIETTGYFILFIDITDAKLLERSKSELVAVASHQLRTPLTAMRGNVEMLIDESFGALNKEQHELLDDINVSTIRLITMVNEMLDITKIEKGNLDMKLEVLDVTEIIDSVISDLSTYAERHEFKIVTGPHASRVAVTADRVRIRQIFQNLIDNAIKYSRYPGELAILTSVSGAFVEIAFADNGIGVPKNEQSKLFGRFYRASNTAKTASSGSGLGLYIVKSIAKQFGGDISFTSEENVGTTFKVTLPLANDQ